MTNQKDPPPAVGAVDAVISGGEPPGMGEPGAERLALLSTRYWNARTVAGTCSFAGAAAALTLWVAGLEALQRAAFIALPVLVMLALLDVLVLNPMLFRHFSYTVTRDYVYIARGRFFRRTLVIATPQILNVEIAQGPLLRAFGMVQLRFVCIVEGPTLGPLLPSVAEELRRRVIGAVGPHHGS